MLKYKLGDDLVCTYLFYQQYQLPCARLWQYQTIHGVFEDFHWEKFGIHVQGPRF